MARVVKGAGVLTRLYREGGRGISEESDEKNVKQYCLNRCILSTRNLVNGF